MEDTYLWIIFAIVDGFFLTATPEHRGNPILPVQPCFELMQSLVIERGIIRDVLFDETTGGVSDDEYRYAVSS